MSVKHINTSKSCVQSTTRRISTISKEISYGNRITFSNSADIIIGNINYTNYLTYKSADQGLKSTISLLNHSQIALAEMHDAAQELHRLYISATTETLSQNELNILERAFQTQINNLDQIATIAKYGSFSLLDGSLDSKSPLQINTPGGDVIDITIPNMTNAGSPIANPGEDDPHVKVHATVQAFQDAVNIPAGNAANVLDNIKAFCGKDSFLYIVADQIDKAFTAGVAAAIGAEYATCLAYLQGFNWDTVLNPSDASVARDLIANPEFSNPRKTLETCIILISVITQDTALYNAIVHAITSVYVPAKYILQASQTLSISSPDYFAAVGERLKIAMNYIASAQSSVNQQIKYIEGMRIMYFEHADQSGEKAEKYLKTNMLESASELNHYVTSQDLAIASTIGFRTQLNQTIADAASRILQR